MRQLLILLVLFVNCSNEQALAEEPQPESFAKLKQAFEESLGEKFSYVEFSLKYEPTFRNRYWAVTIEAKKAEHFTLVMGLKQRKKIVDAQYEFHITILPKGSTRIVSHPGPFRGYALACVGDPDPLQLIRQGPQLQDQRFRDQGTANYR